MVNYCYVQCSSLLNGTLEHKARISFFFFFSCWHVWNCSALEQVRCILVLVPTLPSNALAKLQPELEAVVPAK